MLSSQVSKIDMSLRFWSDRTPLEVLVAPLGFQVAHLHVKDEPMALIGPLSGRPAKRHYAAVAKERGENDAAVVAWIKQSVKHLSFARALTLKMRRGQVEGVFWISVLGGSARAMPEIPTHLIKAVEAFGMRILLENYTNETGEVPDKVWLPSETSVTLLHV